MTTVNVIDENTAGQTTSELTLEFLNERISVRELIRSRVYQEVVEYNARRRPLFRGLVQPSEAETVLNGARPGRLDRRIDWEHEHERALRGFEHQRFLVLVDGQQLDDLDQEIELRPNSQISFLRLVPLVGG